MNKIKYLSLLLTFVMAAFSCDVPPENIGDNFDVLPELNPPVITIKKTYGIVITAFNRPVFLRQTLESLQNSDLSDTIIVIVDDASSDPQTLSLINAFNPQNVPVIKLRHIKNSGVLSGLMHGFKLLVENVDYVLNIDSDVIMKPNWLNVLGTTFEEIGDPNAILSGFNTLNHKTKECRGNWCEKYSLGGINLFMKSGFCKDHFFAWFRTKNRLDKQVWVNWDWTVVSIMKDHGFRFYATTPSVIQHIGRNGLNSSPGNLDIAEDY